MTLTLLISGTHSEGFSLIKKKKKKERKKLNIKGETRHERQVRSKIDLIQMFQESES